MMQIPHDLSKPLVCKFGDNCKFLNELANSRNGPHVEEHCSFFSHILCNFGANCNKRDQGKCSYIHKYQWDGKYVCLSQEMAYYQQQMSRLPLQTQPRSLRAPAPVSVPVSSRPVPVPVSSRPASFQPAQSQSQSQSQSVQPMGNMEASERVPLFSLPPPPPPSPQEKSSRQKDRSCQTQSVGVQASQIIGPAKSCMDCIELKQGQQVMKKKKEKKAIDSKKRDAFSNHFEDKGDIDLDGQELVREQLQAFQHHEDHQLAVALQEKPEVQTLPPKKLAQYQAKPLPDHLPHPTSPAKQAGSTVVIMIKEEDKETQEAIRLVNQLIEDEQLAIKLALTKEPKSLSE